VNSYQTEGIILKRRNFKEADKILIIYSKHFGKISLIAKGIRKTTSKKGGNLELFNQVKISVARGRNLDIVTEVEVIDAFKKWRKNLKKIAVAFQFCELVDKLSADRAENKEVFDLLVNYLKNLSQIENYQLSIKNFELSLLQSLGFWPRSKSTSSDLDLEAYIEDLINRKIFSKKFVQEVTH